VGLNQENKKTLLFNTGEKMFRTSNPAMKEEIFQNISATATDKMTVRGTVNKTAILLLILIISASWTWDIYSYGGRTGSLILFGALGGFAVAMVTIFKREYSPITAPIYAILEGLVLGGVSGLLNKAYPGIVFSAVGLTFGTLGCLLIVYRAGIIQPTENFKLGVISATGGIALYYLLSIILGFFGIAVPLIHSNSMWGIAFSVFVVIIAALNLVLDFDLIETGARAGAPKYMEWYGAFGLMVTLVWLYLEILRLLAKMQRR
jgi:uncharacterized YccA/Bax inhibitor family protein